MKLAKVLSESDAKKIQSFVLYGGVFTTLAIWTKLEDPVNLPKMFVLALFAAIVLGLSIPAFLSIGNLNSQEKKLGLGFVTLFLFGLTVSTLLTDLKYTAIFGEYHRNNGYLSYLAMVILMAASIMSRCICARTATTIQPFPVFLLAFQTPQIKTMTSRIYL